MQQGVDRYQAGDFQSAINNWQTALSILQKKKKSADEAIVLENLARIYQQMGQMEKSTAYWDKIIAYYSKVGNQQQLGRSLIEQAQVYNNLGQPKKAITLLCNLGEDKKCDSNSALTIASTTRDLTLSAAALGSLGDTYRLMGDYTEAIASLEQSLKLAQVQRNSTYTALASNSLGNAHISLALVNYRRAESALPSGDTQGASEKFTLIAKKEDAQARKYLQKSLEIFRCQKDDRGEMRSYLSLIPLYYRTNDTASATSTLQQAIKLLERLPNSQAQIYATIDLARLIQSAGFRFECINSDFNSQAETLLNQAVTVAERLQNFRAKSFALGQLGHMYECNNQYSKAQKTTEQALGAAEQDLKALDSLYLWEWQTGRILRAQGKKDEAISAYERAIVTLERIRQDILTADRDIQFDFRDTIEPIYRDLVELKLSSVPPVQSSDKFLPIKENKENLRSVLRTVDSLKLAELQNYFGNDCILNEIPRSEVDSVANKTTAVFSTIILEEKTAVILSLPDGQKKYGWYNIKRQNLATEIIAFRRGLQSFRLGDYDPKPAQHIYNWMIHPFADDLKQAGVKTLVFIHDGILRGVPMAALHDGKQYLIQRYAIATTPSLSLTDLKPLKRKALQVLVLGLTSATIVGDEEFSALKCVEKEITGVTRQIPGKQLLNQDFTRDRLQRELALGVFPMIHFATHGKFGTDPEETFLVTGDQQKLTFKELDRLIRRIARNSEPLELLTLTACETAVGNERSTLRLAGVAVLAGAKSALASLWAINDPVTAQVATDFYAQLLSNPDTSKAEALQAVQKALIEGKIVDGGIYTHPAFWSPFILIGNWL